MGPGTAVTPVGITVGVGIIGIIWIVWIGIIGIIWIIGTIGIIGIIWILGIIGNDSLWGQLWSFHHSLIIRVFTFKVTYLL